MNQGFTLIELLVVVLIIGILSAVALPQYQTAVERSRATEALTQMSAVRTAMERYHSQHEEWPNGFDQLDVDIPEVDECDSGYGGRNFCISFTNANNVATITAHRRRNNHAYDLNTVVRENSNGTYANVRTCQASTNGDQEATDYCNAIAGGATKASNGF